ncbi:MAG TPA: hypothetical protein VIC29_06750 [Steroidobacteraceae bacterium]|jgi:hypothetical protein
MHFISAFLEQNAHVVVVTLEQDPDEFMFCLHGASVNQHQIAVNRMNLCTER